MSFIRYYKLQQYINNEPTGVFRKGELVDDTTYQDYNDCTNIAPLTRWIETQMTICDETDLCVVEKEQISYDNGVTWVDTGNTRAGDIIEAGSSQCVESMTVWRTIAGEYVCDNYNKYTKEAEYISYDGGSTWTATGNERRGVLLETDSADCGVIYQWLTVPNDWICSPVDGCGDKYEKQVYQISYDNGVNWSDVTPYRERPGALIETQSSDCGCSPEELYQWVVVSGQYTCIGTYKYALEKEQVSIDGGTTWTDTGYTRAGSLIEADSPDCTYIEPVTDALARLTLTNNEQVFIEDENYTPQLLPSMVSEYKSMIKKVELFSNTTSILDGNTGVFENCPYLTEVVTYMDCGCIPSNCFKSCDNFTKLVIMGSATGSSPWRFKDNIQNLVLGSTLTTISSYSFNGCDGLTSVSIPDSVTTIEEGAFAVCTNITYVRIGNSVTSIGKNAFNGNNNLKSITIPQSVTGIGEGNFAYVETVTFQCPTVGTWFDNNQNLRHVILTDSVIEIGDYTDKGAFRNCYNLLSVTFSNNITYIGTHAFSNCRSLTSIVIPNSVTSIGTQAFYGCTGLTSLSIPNSVTSIEEATFRECTGLTSIYIPNSVTSIGNNAFRQCTGLTSITVNATTPPTLGSNALYNTNSCPIYVPAASVTAYQTASGWSSYSSRITAIQS